MDYMGALKKTACDHWKLIENNRSGRVTFDLPYTLWVLASVTAQLMPLLNI